MCAACNAASNNSEDCPNVHMVIAWTKTVWEDLRWIHSKAQFSKTSIAEE